MMHVWLKRAAQTTLPAELRRQLNQEEGKYLEAVAVAEGILLQPIEVLTCWLADAIAARTVQRL